MTTLETSMRDFLEVRRAAASAGRVRRLGGAETRSGQQRRLRHARQRDRGRQDRLAQRRRDDRLGDLDRSQSPSRSPTWGRHRRHHHTGGARVLQGAHRIALVDRSAPPILFQVNSPTQWNGRSGAVRRRRLQRRADQRPVSCRRLRQAVTLAQGFVTVGTDRDTRTNRASRHRCSR